MADRQNHLDFLDGMRGLASLWVLIGHAMILTGFRLPGFAQPDLAVELFIVISGFLMTFHYQAREAREPWNDASTWKIFWVRRFFRIAPLYYICLAVALAFGPSLWAERLAIAQILPDSLTQPDRYLDQSLTNILMHVSFLFGMTSNYNFKTPLPDWSIGLEMQFYAIFPFLMLTLKRFGGLVGMGLLVAAGVAIGLTVEHLGFVRGAYSILAMKFHLFGAGMLIAGSLRAAGNRKLLYIAAAVAVIFIPLGGGRSEFHRIAKILIVLGFFVILYRDQLPVLAERLTRPLTLILSNSISRILGDLSYGVYLIHLLVMLPVCGWLARSAPQMGAQPRFWAAVALTMPISYGLAWLAHRYIEKPGIELGKFAARKFTPQPQAVKQVI